MNCLLQTLWCNALRVGARAKDYGPKNAKHIPSCALYNWKAMYSVQIASPSYLF